MLEERAARQRVDVRFELGHFESRDDQIRLTYGGTALGSMSFAVDPGGERVWADWSEDCEVRSVADAAGLLVGPVFGGLLRLRGTLSLHGCVLDVGGRALVLLARRGTGKSTIAVAAARQGHAVLSDDTAAVTRRADGGWVAHPGYPRLRLDSGTIEALDAGASDAGRVWPGQDKRYLELSRDGAYRFQPEPLRVGAVYELEREPGRTAPSIEVVPGAERLRTLLRHVRSPLAPLDASRRAAEFERLGAFADSVPVSRLAIPDDLHALPTVVATLAEAA